ncbi:MAG: amidase [Rhodospirillaceae bacterium]|jgi:amidase|nr:amidase [Rhodospirillaceae bacterium]MBT5897337.1 amidase [Rhodospirillaceae bacterium]MBT6428894.1 amidase [Rhodospirillaceae bacterium]MBT7757831.1 amidase [Rhodospirillaceae bacterium]
MEDKVGALVPGSSVHIDGAPGGPLSGLTFVAKDLFDVAGHPTGGGNPDWPGNKVPAQEHAWAVQTLLDGGASLVGKTITDEVSLGILGENVFYGTPVNSAAPDRVPGGSSAGSVAAVAAGMCDIALGTDTGGSVRVPASFCGVYGIRPTHGRLDLTGMMLQAPSSDTTGWFARDGATFAKASAVMLAEEIPTALPNRLIVAVDAFGFAGSDMQAAFGPMIERLGALIGTVEEEVMALPGLSTWARAQRTLQPYEGWLTFKDWLERDNPAMAYSVARGLAQAANIPQGEREWAQMMRREARARLDYLLPPGTVLCLPTTPFPAPPKGLASSQTDPLRMRISCLCSHGGLTGVPQVSLPGCTLDGLPVGLSIIGRWGTDAQLVALANAMEEAA